MLAHHFESVWTHRHCGLLRPIRLTRANIWPGMYLRMYASIGPKLDTSVIFVVTSVSSVRIENDLISSIVIGCDSSPGVQGTYGSPVGILYEPIIRKIGRAHV